MTRILTVIAAVAAFALPAMALLAAAPAAAQTQTWQPRPGEPAVDPHRYQVDQHRLETDRLRAGADQREAFARQLELEARLNRRRLEAARRPEPALPTGAGALRSLEMERALRRSASDRRRAMGADLGQIDAWLDRSRE